MKASVVELYELIGFLKTQYVYKSSESKKCNESGKDYPLSKLPGDTLFELVEELESTIRGVEDIFEKKYLTVSLKTVLKHPYIVKI